MVSVDASGDSQCVQILLGANADVNNQVSLEPMRSEPKRVSELSSH